MRQCCILGGQGITEFLSNKLRTFIEAGNQDPPTPIGALFLSNKLRTFIEAMGWSWRAGDICIFLSNKLRTFIEARDDVYENFCTLHS